MVAMPARRPFVQVAGHAGTIQADDGVIIKTSSQIEIGFYEQIRSLGSGLSAWIPEYMGMLRLDRDQRQADTSHVQADAIVLRDLTFPFALPCIMDLKLGRDLTGPGASDDKIARMKLVSASTTSGTLSVRIAGMKIWEPERGAYSTDHTSSWGKSLSTEGFARAVELFFSNCRDLVGWRTIIQDLTERVTVIIGILKAAETRFYSSSLLVIYESDAARVQQHLSDPCYDPHLRESQSAMSKCRDDLEDENKSISEKSIEEISFLSDCKLIDFAHAYFTPGEGPDEDVITGLETFRACLHRLEKIGNEIYEL